LKGGQFEAVEREASPPDWIWLPNALIDGAAKEIPPVELLRQTQRVAILRLFVNLYHVQSLVSDGGIHWRRIRREYSRSRVGERGAFTLWGFSPTHDSMWPDQPFVQPFLTGKIAEEDGRRRDTGIQVFWDAWSVLNDTGLVEMVGHLVEGDTDDAEIIHPCHGGEEIEQQLSDAAHRAGNALLTEGQQSWAVGQSVILVPVRSHLSAVQMMGIARLRYRPRTSATAAWFARQSEWGSWIEHYREIEQNGVQKQQQPQRVLTNVQHQGGIKGRSRGYQRKY
jgi:hypothetical protein